VATPRKKKGSTSVNEKEGATLGSLWELKPGEFEEHANKESKVFQLYRAKNKLTGGVQAEDGGNCLVISEQWGFCTNEKKKPRNDTNEALHSPSQKKKKKKKKKKKTRRGDNGATLEGGVGCDQKKNRVRKRMPDKAEKREGSQGDLRQGMSKVKAKEKKARVLKTCRARFKKGAKKMNGRQKLITEK